MEWVETTGGTVEAAKDLALDRLGVDEGDAEFEVLEEPTSKLLGLKKTDARVRARVRPVPQRAKQERRGNGKKSNRRGGQGRKGGNGGGSRNRGGESGKPDNDKQNARGGQRKAGDDAVPSSKGDNGGRNSDNQKSAQRKHDKQSSDDRGGTQKGQGSRSKQPKVDRSPTEANNNQENAVDDLTVAEQAEAVESFVRGVLGAMGATGETSLVDVDESTVEVHVTGEQLGLLIGPGGRTLSALNELSRTVVQRQAGGARVDGRVFVDVSGYREKRRAALSAFVRSEVDKVLEEGVDVALEPMSSADRKTVHDTIAEIDGVSSLSEGEDPRRRVVIVRS